MTCSRGFTYFDRPTPNSTATYSHRCILQLPTSAYLPEVRSITCLRVLLFVVGLYLLTVVCYIQITDMAPPATQENRGAYICGVDDLRLQTYKLPESLGKSPHHLLVWRFFFLDVSSDRVCMDCIGPNQVRVRIKAVGICGSDVHYVKVSRTLNGHFTKLVM